MSNFNFIAPFYDGLVRLVFGQKLWETQQTHLHHIRSTDKVLILGGGTGKILKWIPDCEVTFLEQSSEMLSRAKQNGAANFVFANFLSWHPDQNFDWVICPFFLDCFDGTGLEKSLARIYEALTPQGRLIVTDFMATTLRHGFLVKLMLLFFRVTAGLRSRRLVDLDEAVLKSGFSEIDYTLQGMVFSAVYGRQ